MKKIIIMLMAVMAICTGCAKNEDTEIMTEKETSAVEITIETTVAEVTETETPTENPVSETTTAAEETTVTTVSENEQVNVETAESSIEYQMRDITYEWLDGFVSGDLDFSKFWDDHIVALDLDINDKEVFVSDMENLLLSNDYTDYVITDAEYIGAYVKISYTLNYIDANGDKQSDVTVICFADINGEAKLIYGPSYSRSWNVNPTENDIGFEKIDYYEYVDEKGLRIHVRNNADNTFVFGWGDVMQIKLYDTAGNEHVYNMSSAYKIDPGTTNWYYVTIDIPETEIASICIDRILESDSEGFPTSFEVRAISVDVSE